MESRKCRQELAANLQANLGQHLIGTLLSAQALVQSLNKRKAPEAIEAEKLVVLLSTANTDVRNILLKLTGNIPLS
ncbi:MAG: hypothetical protein ABI615_05715 [Chthoniobacterales bacterium]